MEKCSKEEKKQQRSAIITNGPGLLAKALGIQTKHSGNPVTGPPIWLEDHGIILQQEEILASPRIGVD